MADSYLLAEPADRVEPFCPYFGSCGGCTLQHFGPPSYMALKQELVEMALRGAHIETTVLPLIEAHGDGRRRATLHARGKAVGYMLDNEPHLRVFLANAAVPIDNNTAENAIRPLALGRKNFLFVGSRR